MFSEILLLNVVLLLVIGNLVNGGRRDWTIEKSSSFWYEQARLSIEEGLKRRENTGIAKNVILFLGDGMGVSTVTGGRIRKGQTNGQLGEDFLTEMEQFTHLGLAKTYNIDHQTPDSAATATAFLCGVKAQLGTVGVDGRAKRSNCSSSIGTNVTSILDWAQKAGKKVGIVSTARITHATPAAAYAHVPERDWESYNTKIFGIRQSQEGCLDIAHQLVLRSPPIDLLFGGGRRHFYPNTKSDIENSTLNGSRTDNRSLIDEFWRGRFIWNKTEMNKIILGTQTPLMGLFEYDHMYYETDRKATRNDKPSLSQMTKFAIEHFLNMKQNGFFLLIEGGRIDHGHHETKARYALDEFVEFDNTIGQTKEILKEKGLLNDTLMIVTADHSHVFTIGAYSSRGSNILGFGSLESRNVSDIDKLPVNIIAYGNGPNFPSPRNATYLSSLDLNSTNYLSPTALPLKDETHGAEDVPIYAHGPWSHLFIGTMEQHTIAHKMAYAACWGPYTDRNGCQILTKSTTTSSTTTSSTTIVPKSNGFNSFKNISVPITILQLFISSSSSSSSFYSLDMITSINIDKNYFYLKKLDQQLFELILLKTFDYEFIQNIYLDFILNKQNLTKKSIEIIIENINDCQPFFNQTNYFFHIQENNQIPFLIYTFQAFDYDYLNQFIYQIQTSDENIFSINSTSGDFWILKSFDREIKSNYSLFICVFDGIYQTCSSIYLNILDENDNICKFNSSSITLTINENLPLNTNLIQIQAYDPDYKQNGTLQYKLSPKTSYLNINLTTGLIQTTINSFDYELIQTYSSLIIACDNINSLPSLCCYLKLYINIIDINDNLPYLIYPSSINNIFIINYTNKTMPRLKAFDNDIDLKNRFISYSIIGGTLNSSINIDYLSGQLYLLSTSILPLYGTLIISLSSQINIQLTILIHDNQTDPQKFLMSIQQYSYSSQLFYFISFISIIIIIFFLIIIFLTFYFFKQKQKQKHDDDPLMNTPSTTTLSTRSILTTTINNKKIYDTYYSFGDSVTPDIIHV
ncbi:unnamed protein product [Rotaria sp. Silwood1]|nr:unnamed protein product [Rotaria sp. Silwood1]